MHTAFPAPIGNGFVVELADSFVARWNAYVLDESGDKKKVTHGPHILGKKARQGEGLRSLAQAQKLWDTVRPGVYAEYYNRPKTAEIINKQSKNVAEFIVNEFEKRREWEDNSRTNWEYYRDAFLVPAFGTLSLEDFNNEDRLNEWIKTIGRQYSYWTTKKALDYARAIGTLANYLGLIVGNAAKLVKIPKSVKKPKSQPALTLEQFAAIYRQVPNPRDKMILKILWLCGVRRGEMFVIKWKDWDGANELRIERSFDSQTHKIKEWAGKIAGGASVAKVAVPPSLIEALNGWRKFGYTNASDLESYIFPTRNGTPIIPTNWHEDVLKPAGIKAKVPGVTYQWFRRGHATVQHYGKTPDKAIQGQLRHAKVETTQNSYMMQIAPETLAAVIALDEKLMSVL
jgi:integrase